MSRSDYMAKQRVYDHAVRESKSELVRLGWIKLTEMFEKDRDFPLDYEKPVIDNAPDSNTPPRIYPRPWHGSKRAYLRRRERGIL